MIDLRALRAAVFAALLLGAVMTAGDFIWEVARVRHSMGKGIAHGVVMCLCIGAVIGFRTGRLGAGLLAGPVIGVIASGTFYLLAPLARYYAMLPAWMLFWICFGVLQQRLQPERGAHWLVQGTVAALLSGLAFYAISGIWTHPAPGGPNYPLNFASWSFAFLPGFLALFFATRVRLPTVRDHDDPISR